MVPREWPTRPLPRNGAGGATCVGVADADSESLIARPVVIVRVGQATIVIRRMPKRLDRLAIPSGSGTTRVVFDAFPPPPAVRFLGLTQAGPEWTNELHRHAEYELHYVRRGSGTLLAQGRRFAVSTGDIYLFRPSEDHGGWADARDPAQVLYIGFTLPPALAREALAGVGDKPIFLHEDVRELRGALRALADELAALAPDAGAAVAPASVPLAVVARSLRVLSAVLEPAQRRVLAEGTPHERELAEAVLREVDARGCAGPLPLRALAARHHVTAAHLGAVVRRVTGKTYPQHLAEVRARHALELLEDRALPVREVARRVGLSGARALARVLRRVTGRAPRRDG